MRFIISLIIALILIALAVTPLTEKLLSGWFRRDVELRSQLIFQSVEDTLTDSWKNKKSPGSYQRLFDKIARDERVMAAGLCTNDGRSIAGSTLWSENKICPENIKDSNPSFIIKKIGKGTVLVSSFPLGELSPRPYFVVLHDLTFSIRRTNKSLFYLAGFVILVSFIAALVTILTARITLRNWLGRLRHTLSNPQTQFGNQGLPREFLPVVREMRQMLRDIKPSSAYQIEHKVDWTEQTLKKVLEQELPNSEVIVVSNREPYIHNRNSDGKITLQRPASGLVTALEPITRACNGIWIAHGSGNADKEMVDSSDCIAVPPEKPEYTLRRVWLTKQEEEGYYYGLANEGLWPLCHITFVRPIFRESDWQAYKEVNRKFADAIIKQAKTKNPVVLVQDYHFSLLPSYIREKLPDATIITFWHIPWPNPEVFSICPWREEILSGLLGSSVLGFHTQFHCQNFLDTVDRFLESHIDRDQSVVTVAEHPTLIRPYPISIAWPPEGLDKVAKADTCRKNVRERFNISDNVLIGVGVERFDYTKGIIDRFQAIKEFLQNHAEWRGRFTFIQAAAPSRSQLPAYQSIQREAYELVDSINREFGTENYKPIILSVRHHEPEEVFELFRASDLCVVSSLHDGMNLVAKEFVAAREDEKGVLILSTFAGASKELLEALLVNPYDTKGMAEALFTALTMTETEQRERMRLLRDMVRDNNIYYWAARMLIDAAQLRKRANIESFISRSTSQKNNNGKIVEIKSKPRRTVS